VSSAVSTEPNWVRIGRVTAVVAVVFGVSLALPYLNPTPGDQEVYALAAERALAGEQFYRPDQTRAFTYPPFCVLYFVPFDGLSEPLRRGLFYFLNVTLLVGVVWLTSRSLAPMRTAAGPPGWVSVAIVTVLAGRFAISPIEYQGHDLLVFLLTLLAVVAWSRSRWVAAGLWAGVGAATKVTPALLLPVFLWNRNWRAAGVLVATAVLLTFLPDLLLPGNDGRPWLLAWYGAFVSKIDVGTAAHASGAWSSWNLLNQSLAGTVYRLATFVPADSPLVFDVSLLPLGRVPLKSLTLALQCCVLGVLAYATRPGLTRHVDERERRVLRMGQGAAVMCGMLLLSPMSSKAHFCTLLLPLTFIVSDFLNRRRELVTGGSLLVVFLLGTLTAKDLVGKVPGDLLLAYGSLTWCTIACLLGVTCSIARRSAAFSVATASASDSPATPATPLVTTELRPAA
jgi:alpha-1,2-mannosyltransferase